jgi:hypothetical protein
MTTVWTVERNTGARAGLVMGSLKRQLWRSLAMSREEFFQLLPKGTVVDEAELANIVNILEP